MKKKTAAKTVLIVCVCSMLCACSVSPASSADLPVVSEQTDTSQDESTTVPITGETESADDSGADKEDTSEPVQSGNEQTEYDFVPVLTEDDIEYMGIPYKDLTAEQFIQLWAQCTRECNVQRLYVITYNNYSYKDELTGELREPTEHETEELLKDYARRLVGLQLEGRILFLYNDAELFKVEDAPDGYYDSDDAEEHIYCMTSRRVWYDLGNTGEENKTSWITLKKINGYWKIGLQFSSSPPFLDVT